jgi:hypothetical protein
MIRIDIPAGEEKITQETFETYNLPRPPNGTEIEINGDIILLFDDEAQAISYLDKLEDNSTSVANDAPARKILSLIIGTISNDKFVQDYLR